MSEKNDVVMIELDRPRELRFGNKAIKQIEKITGKSFFKIDTDELSADQIEKIMFCGLRADAAMNGETLKLEDMEDLLDKTNYGNIIMKFTEALETAFGQLEGKANGKNPQGIAEQKAE